MTTTRSTTRSTTRPALWTYTLLGLILLAGLTLRTWNLRWDVGMNTHPDERSTTCGYAPSIGLPSSWEEFKDPQRSPLNPLWNREMGERRSFTYGHFPLYLGVATGEVLHTLAPVAKVLPISARTLTQMETANTACGGVAVAGRLVMALLDTLTILLLFFLGRRVYGRGAGLLAAAFYAFTAQAIQLSHFFAMDPASTTFTVLAVLGGVIMVQDRSWRAVIITGVGAGLAISSKFSALPILAVPVVAAALVLWQARGNAEVNGRVALRVLLGAPLALILAAVTFALTSPYAILDWESFVRATLVEQGAMVRGIADFPFTRQYRNTTPYLYFIEQQVAWGLWWPLGILAVLGTLWAAVKFFIGRARPGEWIVWAWVVPYFGLTGAFLAKFNRYMSPVLPFVVLFAAGLIWTISTQRRREAEAQKERENDAPATSHFARRTVQIALAALLAAIGLAGSLFWSLAYVNGVYTQPHPWETTAVWMAENVPPGSVVLCEQWDDCMPWGVPDLGEVNSANSQIRRIDRGPYEEDSAQKYEILKAKLREADYVAYSSKRIYGSVDELPKRYPMTTEYYRMMFNGDLGFEKVWDYTTYPQLFGLEFPDASADESWSLYDHPQVTIFKKTRQLSDAEFDQLLGGTWESAEAYYRGEDSPLDPLLNALGLGSRPETQNQGLLNRIIALLRGEELPAAPPPPPADPGALLLDRPLAELPVVDDFRWNRTASESGPLAVAWWWLVISLLGWLAWPIAFAIFRPLRDRGYLLSRALGWLLAGWLLWLFASFGLAHNTVINSWLAAALVGVAGLLALIWQWREIGAFLRRMGPLLLVGELIFAAAYLLFVGIRLYNPDLWQPWFGGEKFMEYAFLNGILRSPTFPPVDPHFAGGYINYYYFGIYLVAYVIKLTGIYAEVAFNLAIPTLFALTVVNAFGVAYSAVIPLARRRAERVTLDRTRLVEDRSPLLEWRAQPLTEAVAEPTLVMDSAWDFSDYRTWGESAPTNDYPYEARTAAVEIEHAAAQPRVIEMSETPAPTVAEISEMPPWPQGIGWALLAPLFVAILGNLDGFAQIARKLIAFNQSSFESAIPGVTTLVQAISGLWFVIRNDVSLPPYDFWTPSRVIGAEIQATINEFPYWSFTFADLHPHMIGIPFSVLFLGLVLTLLLNFHLDWRRAWRYGLLLLGVFALLLGTLASINLWELPTFYALGVLTLAVTLFRGHNRLDLPLLAGVAVLYIAGAFLLFWPFFSNYENIGASGVGLVRAPDKLGQWLLIWGFFFVVLVGWLGFALRHRARPADARPGGLERWLQFVGGQPAQMPRFLRLHHLLVKRATIGYLLGQWMLPLLIVVGVWLAWRGWTILAICLPLLGLAFLLLWRRGRSADAGSLFIAVLATTGFALLAGTQIIYLRDFLGGGDYYRMNTLFKFFIQVWVLWGTAAAVAVARILADRRPQTTNDRNTQYPISNIQYPSLRPLWLTVASLLFIATLAYPLWGTPARVDQRFPGWRPEIGTLDALDFMRQGVYSWPDGSNAIELTYDWQAIDWIQAHMHGNFVIAESSETDYYRAGGTRIASMTGLSGLSGKHEGEQRYGEQVGARSGVMNEFWNASDPIRSRQLMESLEIDLIYVGQLERYLHPVAVETLARMAADGDLIPLYQNDRAILYAVPGRVMQTSDGQFYPVPGV